MARGKHSVPHKSRKSNIPRVRTGKISNHGKDPVAAEGAAKKTGRHGREGRHFKRPVLSKGLIAAGIIAVIVIAVVLFLNYGPLSAQQRARAAQEYIAIENMLDEADETLSPISELMAKDLTSDTVGRIQQVLQGKDAAMTVLAQALSRYAAVSNMFDPLAEGTVSSALEDGIKARQDMLQYGSVVLNAGVQVFGCRPKVTSAWKDMIDGDNALKKAAKKVDVGTSAAVKAALSSDRGAKKAFESAQRYFAELAASAPNVDFSAENNYLAAQIEAADAAIAEDEALLKNDNATAKANLEKYKAATDKVAEYAKNLPASSDDLVKTIYYSFGADGISVTDAEVRYRSAVDRVAADDLLLASFDESKGNDS